MQDSELHDVTHGNLNAKLIEDFDRMQGRICQVRELSVLKSAKRQWQV